MLNIDLLFIVPMVLLSFIGLMFVVLMFFIDFSAKYFFSKTEADLIKCNVYQAERFISDLKPAYSVCIYYTYSYNGEQYKNSRLNSFDSVITSKSNIESMIDSVKITDDKITVYVCPFLPSYSIVFSMKPLYNGQIYFMFYIGLFVFLIGCYFLYFQIKLH